MARIMPTGLEEARLAGAHSAELVTLERLAVELPDTFSIFHSVRWMEGDARRHRFGEADFLVVNQSGDVLLIEQKNGALEEGGTGLAKQYQRGAPKSVIAQIHRSRDALLTAYERRHSQDARLHVSVLVYCPDHVVSDLSAAGLPAEAIVDGTAADGLATRIATVLGEGIDRGDGRAQRVRGWLAQSLALSADITATVQRHETAWIAQSGGLAELLDGLHMTPVRLRVQAAAGSGKTQMAARFYQRAIAQGRRPLFLCFNRSLADRVRAQLPDGGLVDTFHGFCVETCRRAGYDPAFSRAAREGQAFWRELEGKVLEAIAEVPPFDVLVVDEGQDFDQEWWEVLQLILDMDAADVVWVEDAAQRIYDARAPVELTGFVEYRTTANFRNPRRIADFIQRVLPIEIDARNPLPGLPPAVHVYASESEQLELLEARVCGLLELGFKPDQIVVISMHGRERGGSLSEVVELAGMPIHRYTGRHESDGTPIFTEGSLLFETIYRFKGQHAPAVLITDLDFADRGERESTIVYCAMTRAKVALEVFVQAQSGWKKVMVQAGQ
jgi:hypothetical protein